MGSTSGTSELKKSLKIDIFVFLCDNSAHKTLKELVCRKFDRLLRTVCCSRCGNRIKFVNFFSKQGGSEQC